MQKTDRKKILLYLAVIALLVFLYFSGPLKFLEGIFLKATNPVAKYFYSFSSDLRDTYNKQEERQELLNKIDILNEKVNLLTEENIKYRIYGEENEILREYLKFFTKNEFRYVLSNVVSRGDFQDKVGTTESIVINKGESDGVFKGYAVVSGKGIMIGKVVEAKDDISRVLLTKNEDCRLAATIMNEEKTSGIAEGDLGLTIKMDFIPPDKKFKAGDTVITSGLEEFIPRGLVIGNIINVKKESNELWQSATIEPIVDLDDLITVAIIIP